jgi:hypothetical protein
LASLGVTSREMRRSCGSKRGNSSGFVLVLFE